ncbi:hypothetical protein B0J14DRAFT_567442 [Halenospora varia]|nr:hypothetical protein B0J14DRAFT_567442 [Halenospora varia]
MLKLAGENSEVRTEKLHQVFKETDPQTMFKFVLTGFHFSPAYRDGATKLADSSVYRKIVDGTTNAELCPICLQREEVGEEMVTLRCECRSWAHEPCLAQSVFETGGCPSCKPLSSFDPELLLLNATEHGDISKARQLLESGTYHSTRDIFDGTPLIRAAQHGHRELIHLLLGQGASVSQGDTYHQTAGVGPQKGGRYIVRLSSGFGSFILFPSSLLMHCTRLLIISL